MAESYHDRTVAALTAFINQRPGLEPGNYIRDWRDEAGRRAYRADARSITRSLSDARQLVTQVQWREFTAGQWARAFEGAYSGRLTWDGSTLDYCIGQHRPTEYRSAACAVLASLLWADYRDRHKALKPDAADSIRDHFRRVLGRGIARRWFN
jgi:hypothetical protein